MAVNRFDQPVQAQYISQYVPIPFEQLYNLGQQYNAQVDKNYQDLGTAITKFSDFQSPSAKDMQNWNKLTIEPAKQLVNEIAANPDLMKTPEGRARIQQFINSRPYGELSALKQSRDNMLKRQALNQQLAISGKYNPLWHDVDFTNYDTLSQSGVFNDLSPLAYKSEVDLVKPYVDNLKPSYLYTKGGYDYSGVSTNTTDEMVKENISAIYNTPEAQMHIKTLVKQGYDYDTAKDLFTKSIYQAGREFAYKNREANPYSLLSSNIAATKTQKEQQEMPTIGWNDILSKQYSNKLKSAVLQRSYTDKDFSNKYNSMLENESDPNKIAEIQILAMDEAVGRNVADAFRRQLGLKETDNPFAKMDLKGSEGSKYYTDSRISKMWEKGLNAMYEKVTPGALQTAKTILFGDADNTVEYGAHKSKGYLADGINLMSPKQYIQLNNRYINELAQDADFDFSAYRDRDTWSKSNLDIEELVANKEIGNVIVKEVKGYIDSNSPERGATRDYVVRVTVPISELTERYNRWWAYDDLPKTLKEYGFTVEKGTESGIGSEGYVSFDMVVPSTNNEIDITTSNRGYEKDFGTSTTQKEIVGADNTIMQVLRDIKPGDAWNLK